MDPLRNTKIVGALCLAGLVFLFGRWGAEALTTRGMPDEHHAAESDTEGEHEAMTQAYTIEVAAAGGDEVTEEGPDVGALMAAADPAKGENVFKKCKACHSMEIGKNGTGPELADVVGRVAGTVAGFDYSDAMVAFGKEWTPEELFIYLGDVKGTVPGTKMSFPGLKKPEDRADLIAYLMGPKFNAGDFSAAAPAATEEASADDAAPAEGEATTDQEAQADTADADAAVADEVASAGDPVAGEKVFKKCKACHSIEPGKNGTGPSLFGVVGRAIGTEPGYKYSEAMATHGGTWDNPLLDVYLQDVKGTVPGTKMSFPGLKKPEDRANLIAYLDTLQ